MAVGSGFHIPTIDIGPYIKNPSSEASSQIIDQVGNACRTTGFFQLVGHGISPQLQDDAFKASAELFSLPDEEKKKLLRNKSLGAVAGGYEVMGSQRLQKGKLPDLSESFYVSWEGSETLAKDSHTPWPFTIPEERFKNPMLLYHQNVFDLATLILEILSRGLPYGPHIFDEFISGEDVIAPLRLLHYPPQTSTEERQLGVGAHTDFGAITLLLQDDNPGLQVLDESTGQWIPVPPNGDAYVINIGDMLAMWTKGFYKSGTHRVVNRSTKHRYSLPFFFDGALNCPLAPFDGSQPEGEVLTVKGHLDYRRTSSYAGGLEEKK